MNKQLAKINRANLEIKEKGIGLLRTDNLKNEPIIFDDVLKEFGVDRE